MSLKQIEDRVAAIEDRLGKNKVRLVAWCGHEKTCRWKLPSDLHNCLVVGTGVPRPSCETGNLADDLPIYGGPHA
jgi:hypothetical protein